MLHDPIPSVVVNTVCALNEIYANDGEIGMPVSSKLIKYLLSRIEKFDDQGKALILEVVSRYTPKNDDEMYDIMNFLYSLLKLVRSSVILATIKVYLNISMREGVNMFSEVIDKVKGPLLTLMSSRDDDNKIRVGA